MTNPNYETSFLVDQTPQQAYDAINNVRGWWSGEIDGPTEELGGEFTYRYKDVHYSKQRITELAPGKRVVWRVLDAYLNFVEDKNEWNGTEIHFDIAERDGKTEVRFTHVGLAQHECFNVCSDAWGFYIKDSLRKLITTGKGDPNPE